MAIEKKHPSRDSGNALFLILVAVALLAALSFAVTQTGKGSGSVNREQVAILAAQIAQNATAIRGAEDRMLLTNTAVTSMIYSSGAPTNSCPSSPGTPDVPFGVYNDFCTSGTNCLFASDGGGAPLPVAPPAAFTTSVATFSAASGINSHVGVSMVGTGSGLQGGCNTSAAVSGVGTAASELLIAWANLTPAVCQAINTGLGISGIPVNGGTWNISAPVGQQSACIKYSAASTLYVYYQVLIAN